MIGQWSGRILGARNGRLLFFGFLYFIQGAMLAYVQAFNNLYLRAFGASAAQLSLLNGLLVLPFILKIFIGIFSDSHPIDNRWLGKGHRLPYIRFGAILIMFAGAGAGFIHPVDQYPLFVLMALLIALGLAFFDTMIDGWAVDVTPDTEHGYIQGAMVVGRAIGFVLMAAVYGRMIVLLGWQSVFATVTLLAIPTLLILLAVTEGRKPATDRFQWEALRDLWRAEIGWFFLFALVYSIAIYGTNAIIALFINEELGSTLIQVGDAAALGGAGMIVGGLLAVWLTQRTSIWQQGIWTAGGIFITLLFIGFFATLENMPLVFFIWGIGLAAFEFVFVTLAMQKADRRMGAGHFAIFMAMSNIGVAIGQATTTGLIDTVDFHLIFIGMAVVSLLTIPLLNRMREDGRRWRRWKKIRRRRQRRRFR
jgi:PAT family beta-lactamase induction signal transducer AmpG